MASSDFDGTSKKGSIQHSSLAQGLVLTVSGGSVPMLRQTTKRPDTVFILSLRRYKYT